MVESMAFPSVAFLPEKGDSAIEILVNFGLFTGRAATPAEIDRLAERLLDTIEAVTIVGEERHEIGNDAEAVVHQVRIEVARSALPDQADQATLVDQLLERAKYWAGECAADSYLR
jgi:hypothetical protein